MIWCSFWYSWNLSSGCDSFSRRFIVFRPCLCRSSMTVMAADELLAWITKEGRGMSGPGVEDGIGANHKPLHEARAMTHYPLSLLTIASPAPSWRVLPAFVACGSMDGQRASETPPRPRAKSASSVDLVGPPASLRGRALFGALAASGFDGIRRPGRRHSRNPCPACHTPTLVSAVFRRFSPIFPGGGREKPNQEKNTRKTPASP